MVTTWSVREARARFATVLAAARGGEPQIVRAEGEKDVRVSLDDAAARQGLPLNYVLASLAERDGMDIALEQWEERELGEKAPRIMGDMHLPPNLSGDVAEWIRRERGAFGLAMHVVDTALALRNAQEKYGLPRSTVSAMAAGLDLTAGGALIDTETCRAIANIVRRTNWYGETADEVLGDDWHQIALRGVVPDDL